MKEIKKLSRENSRKALDVLKSSGVERIWREAGCRVNLVGSLRMGLLMKHQDIDLHVYSAGITIEGSFAVAAAMARNPDVLELKCINGLHTDEHCVAWHVLYRATDGSVWQIDIIHIEEGTRYDGYFEKFADRIKEIMTPEERDTILRLKWESPEESDWHGVEYYEAVISGGVRTIEAMSRWVTIHREQPPYYWMP